MTAHDNVIRMAVGRWRDFQPTATAHQPSQLLGPDELQGGVGTFGSHPQHTADFHNAAAVLAGSLPATTVSGDFFSHPLGRRMQAHLVAAGRHLRTTPEGVVISHPPQRTRFAADYAAATRSKP